MTVTCKTSRPKYTIHSPSLRNEEGGRDRGGRGNNRYMQNYECKLYMIPHLKHIHRHTDRHTHAHTHTRHTQTHTRAHTPLILACRTHFSKLHHPSTALFRSAAYQTTKRVFPSDVQTSSSNYRIRLN